MSKKNFLDADVTDFVRNQVQTANNNGENLLQSITSPEVREKIQEIRQRKHVGRPRKDQATIPQNERYINATFAINEMQMQKIKYICKKLGFQQKELLFALFGEIIRNYETKHGVITDSEINDADNIINSILEK